MLFGFDLDGCIVNFHPTLIQVAKESYGEINIKEDDWGLGLNSKEKEEELVNLTLNRWMEHKPYPEAVEFVEEYYKRTWNKVYFITSRPKKFEDVTKKWLKHYLDSHIDYQLIHTENKVEVAKEKRLTHFVEDKASTVDELAEAGFEVFMPIREWNQEYQNEKVNKFKDWEELKYLLEGLGVMGVRNAAIKFLEEKGFEILSRGESLIAKGKGGVPFDVVIDLKRPWKKQGKWQGYETFDVPIKFENSEALLYIVFNETLDTLALTFMGTILKSSRSIKRTKISNKEEFFNVPVGKFIFFKFQEGMWIEINKNGGEIR